MLCSLGQQLPLWPSVYKRTQALRPPVKGPPKKKKKKNKQQKNNPKKQPTDFPSFFFFFRCPLRRLWAVCGHATACGHPQLAAVSSFTSWFPLMTP
jgi:hypothetical protein